MVLIAAGIFLALSDFGLMGSVGNAVLKFQKGLAGQGFFLIGVFIVAAAILSYIERGKYLRKFKIAALTAAFFAAVSIIELMFGDRVQSGTGTILAMYTQASQGAEGGGLIGGLIAGSIVSLIGYAGTYFILIVIMLIAAVIISEKSFVSAARKGAEKTANVVKIGAGKTAEAAREGRERYAEHRAKSHSRKEAEREAAREERLLREQNKKSGQDEMINGGETYGHDPSDFSFSGYDAEAYIRYGREIIGSGQPNINDLGHIKEPMLKRKYRSKLNAGGMNFDTEVMNSIPDDMLSSSRPVNIREINYDDDSVPFEEEKNEKYRSYSDILNLDNGVINAEAAGIAGYAAGRTGNRFNNFTVPSAIVEEPESFDAFKESWEEPSRPKINLEGFGDGYDAEDENLKEVPFGAGSLKVNAEGLEAGAGSLKSDAESLSGEEEKDAVYENTYFTATGKKMETPDEYEASLILGKKLEDNHSDDKKVSDDAGNIDGSADLFDKNKAQSGQIKNTHGTKRSTGPAGAGSGSDISGSAVNAQNAGAVITNPQVIRPKPKPYVFPEISLLLSGKKKSQGSREEAINNARKLERVLNDFGVGVTVSNVIRGPRVSRYELIPDIGVKVSRITSLAGDIKLALASTELRIEAPIPGKSAVGIEVPNSENHTVRFRDIVESDEFKNADSKLIWGIGLDIQGRPVIADISKMPHVLVAGTTGSGKSVGINSLIMSILYRSSPEDVRLILIDPKVVELSVYNGIPHLLTDVVTKPDKAIGALNWAVAEMNRRYELFNKSATRNIAGYNEKVSMTLEKLPDDVPEEERPNKLPYILIIIDELSELMMHSKKDVEAAIISLSQLARASGIHLVVATQRPSVDVITGVIKSNIPSRIAYRLPSAVDSRTILDSGGAETLLGNGDMLYKPGDKNSPERVQGAFLSDDEVESVVDFIRKNNAPEDEGEAVKIDDTYREIDFDSVIKTETDLGSERDDYFKDAGIFIINNNKASIGMLQRKFKIGFNRAARIMDQLHEAGVVSDSEGTKERQILMDMEEFLALTENGSKEV